VTAVDGRVQRGERNRQAIVDALLSCYEDGSLRPSVAQVAERAGVSARSVHNHFADVEAMRADLVQRQGEKYAPLLGEVRTIDELIAQRAIFFEAVTPVRRAALLSVHDSPSIARGLARLDRMLRRQLEALYPTVENDVLDALDLATSWDAWNRLRSAQECSVARARRVVEHTVRKIIEGI
jgi:AcrR family transcriptional regulator